MVRVRVDFMLVNLAPPHSLHIHANIHVHIQKHTHTNTHTHTHTHTNMHTHTRIHIHTNTHAHTGMHTTILAEASASGPSAAPEVVTMVMVVDSEMDTEGTTADEDSGELFRIMMDHHINVSNTIDVEQIQNKSTTS